MSRKIFTVLVPVAAIMALVIVPSLAQATQSQCGGVECAKNASISGQSSTLRLQTQNPHSIDACTNSVLKGGLAENQKETLEGIITSTTFTGCSVEDQAMPPKVRTVHITSNAAPTAAWTLQLQQPVPGSEPGASFVGHIDPFPGSSIQFTVQIQEFGFSDATCDFSASTIQVAGHGQSDSVAVTEGQFELQSRDGILAALCGTVKTTLGHLTGDIQFETDPGGAAVVVHMS